MLSYTNGGYMAEKATQVRVLVWAAAGMQEQLHRQISSFGMVPTLVTSAEQLAPRIRAGDEYQVVLLPASLPHTEDWWAIWGDVAMLRPKPAILVYAHSATFQLWSGVLEAGGYDVIVEPLTDEKLKEALLRAAEGWGPDAAGEL
jgi:DNA-binding NtrC family response regulator